MLRPVPFTKENAAAYGRQGAQALIVARQQHASWVKAAANGDDFQATTLARTRELLSDTLARMAKATDPKDLELLARAASHMAELERRLAGRPLPGTTRRDGPAAPPPRAKLPDPR